MTNQGCWPLLDVFLELRRRDFPLGVDEYVLALQALAAGFGEGSRKELMLLCQSLWSHSIDESEQIADVLNGLLPLEVEIETIERPRSDITRKDVDPTIQAAAKTDTGRSTAGIGLTSINPGEEPGRMWQLNARFDFMGSLPVTKRQISQAWRHYRRMGRTGQRTEFDADATITRFYREGVLLEPVLISRRVNQARLLILEDVGGSMVPFRYVTRSIIESARHVGLAHLDVKYFHDIPRQIVFRDPDQRVPVHLEEVIAPFSDAGILIYSDAGAARGSMDEARVNYTAEFLTTLRSQTTAIAWLNPVPRHRWIATSAQAICSLEHCAVPMFALDRHGVIGIIDVLRGRRN